MGKAAFGLRRTENRVLSVLLVLCGWIGFLAGATPSAEAQGMAAQGSFAVSETGAAIYTIPIAIPPGIASMEPKLSLTYNSQGGNGHLGVGWSLQGLSAITRCSQTIAQDNFRSGVKYDKDDRFCLDGQRLVMSTGANYGDANSVYRTEKESFARVTASAATQGYDRAPLRGAEGRHRARARH